MLKLRQKFPFINPSNSSGISSIDWIPRNVFNFYLNAWKKITGYDIDGTSLK